MNYDIETFLNFEIIILGFLSGRVLVLGPVKVAFLFCFGFFGYFFLISPDWFLVPWKWLKFTNLQKQYFL